MSQCSNSLRQLAAAAHLPFHVTLHSQLGGPSACDSIQRTGLASVVTIPPAVQLRGGLRPLQRAARALVPSPPRSGIRSSPPPAVHLPLAPAAKAALHCASMFCTKRGVVIFAWPRGLCRCLVRLVSSILHLLLRGLLSRSRSLLSTSLALTLVAWGGSPHFPSGRRVGGGVSRLRDIWLALCALAWCFRYQLPLGLVRPLGECPGFGSMGPTSPGGWAYFASYARVHTIVAAPVQSHAGLVPRP